MSDDLEDTIRDAAAGPLKAATDAVSAENHPLPDLIAADKYLASKAAADNGRTRGLRFSKIVPPGAD